MVDLRWILETLPVGVWVARVPSGEVVYANPRFRDILGMDAVPRSRIEDAPATYRIFDRTGRLYPVDELPFSRVVSTGRAAMVDDLVVHRPDGDRANVRAFAYPKLGDDGKLSHVVIAFIDITAEVKAVVEREAIEARLALAVNHAPIVVWATDVNGVVTLSEGVGLAALGVKSGQLVGQNLFDLYRDHATIPGFLRRGLAGESLWYTVQVGDATFDTWLMPLRDAAGEIVGVGGLSNDVSEIRTLQAKTIQSDRAIALDTLAANVAQQINNPLTYVLGHQELLQETLEQMGRSVAALPDPVRQDYQSLVARIQKTLETVRLGTERIAAITRELRTFNRDEAQQGGHEDVP
jgi:PAS domain-containing protein